jgi:hypothetical protein
MLRDCLTVDHAVDIATKAKGEYVPHNLSRISSLSNSSVTIGITNFLANSVSSNVMCTG